PCSMVSTPAIDRWTRRRRESAQQRPDRQNRSFHRARPRPKGWRLGNRGISHKKAQKTQKESLCFLCLFVANSSTSRCHTPSSSDKDNYVRVPRCARSVKYSSCFLSTSSR